MHRSARLVLAAAIVASPLLVVSAGAGTPAQVCAGAKMKAAGKSAGLKLACHAKAARQGATVDSTCLAKATTKLSTAFTKAESRGGCNTTGDANDVTDRIDSSVGAFVAELRPTVSANRCAGIKLKATGKKAKTKLGCHAKATRKGVAVDPQCLAKAEARFASTFSSAEAHGPCLTTGDAGGIESGVDDLVNDVVASLASGSGTTCGNGVVEGSEQCDTTPQGICIAGGRSGCFPSGNPNECKCCTVPGETGQVDPGGTNECCDGSLPQPAGPGAYMCQSSTSTTTTTTLGPVCGNGVREGSEQCDTNPEPICVTSGRSGCFPSGDPEQCKCCTAPGETGLIDGSVPNECCDGQLPQPAGPGAYFCPGTCGTGPFPTCGGSCQSGMTCVPLTFGGVNVCACVPPGPCGGTPPLCTAGECPAGQVCSGDACACFVVP